MNPAAGPGGPEGMDAQSEPVKTPPAAGVSATEPSPSSAQPQRPASSSSSSSSSSLSSPATRAANHESQAQAGAGTPAGATSNGATGNVTEKKRPNIFVRIGKILLGQWLTIGCGLACLLAWFFPDVGAHGGPVRAEYTILYGAVALIFLVSGAQLSHVKLREHALNLRLHVVVQGTSFVVIPPVVLAIIHICLAAGAVRDNTLQTSVLVGMLVTACIPTTIASNVVMTRMAGGDDAAAIIEVVLGNVLGSFISSFLIYGLLPRAGAFADWQPADPSTLADMYGGVMRQLGLSVLLPLAAGQLVRFFFERPVAWVVQTFYLGKVSGAMLILIVWSTFSGAFKTGALQGTPAPSVIFNVFMNLGLCLLFTVVSFFLARPPRALCGAVNPRVADSAFAERWLPGFARRVVRLRPMPRAQTVAVCFCGAAKSTSIGIPLVAAMWRESDELTRALIQVPVLLYTIEQVFVAQGLVHFFRWYLKRDLVEGIDGDKEKGGEGGGGGGGGDPHDVNRREGGRGGGTEVIAGSSTSTASMDESAREARTGDEVGDVRDEK